MDLPLKDHKAFTQEKNQLQFGFNLLCLMTNNQVWEQEPLQLHLVRARVGRLVQLQLIMLYGDC